MTRDNNNKLRAVFLAALMFLWLFAGTVAFAGSAAAQDRSINGEEVNGASIFQGQETEFNFTDVNATRNNGFNLSDGDTVQIQRITDRDNGNPITATTSLTSSLDGNNISTFETDSLQSGESYVIRFETENNSGFLAASNTINDTTLGSNFNAAEFTVNSQTLSTAFEDDDGGTEVRAGNSIEFQLTSNERAEFTANITEANGELDNDELLAIFNSSENSDNISDITTVTSENLDDDDDTIQVRFEDNNFDRDLQIGDGNTDIDPGEYEIEFDVNDTTAESTAELTVLEEVDNDADFDQGTYTTTRGDVIEINGTTEGTNDFVNVTIGDAEDDGFQANVTVEPNDDDEFTLLVNTFRIGTNNTGGIDSGNISSDTDVTDFVSNQALVGTQEDQGEIESAEITDNTSAVLASGNYELQIQADNREDSDAADLGNFDIATMNVEQRSLEGIQLWRADEDIEPGDFDDLDALLETITGEGEGQVTQTDTLAVQAGGSRHDTLIHQIEVSGVQGVGNDAEGLLNSTDAGVSLEFEQTDTAGNDRPFVLDRQNTDFSNIEVFVDGETDTVYAVADPADLRFERRTTGADDDTGIGADSVNLDTAFEVRYNTSADFLNEFLIDDDLDVGADEDDEIVSQDLSVEERDLEFETIDGEVVAPPSEDAEISGTTNIAPGTEFDVRAQGTGDGAFLRDNEASVGDDGSFATTLDLSDIESGTSFDAEVRNQGFEEDAETAGVVSELEGATFTVSNLAPQEAEVEQGTAIDVSATISNEGDSSGNQSVALTLDGDELDSQEIELDAGEETEVAFEGVDTSELAEGSYEHGIATDDDSATGTLTITVPSEGDDGASDDGSTDDGASDDGSADDGEMDDGAADDGGDGAADDGTEDQPGFGAVVALIALLGAALLAARRNAQE